MFFKRNSAFTLLLLLGTSVRDTFTMPSSLIPLVPRMGNLPSKMTSTVLNAFKSEGIQISKVLVSNLSPVSNGYAFSIHSKAKDAAKKPIWARNCVHAPSDPFGWDNCGRTGKQATAQTEPLYDDVWSRIKIIGGATVNEAAQRVQTATNMVEKSLNNARQANLNALNAAKQQPDSARTKELQHAATAADIREASARQELVEAKVFRAQQSTERKFKVALIFHFENQYLYVLTTVGAATVGGDVVGLNVVTSAQTSTVQPNDAMFADIQKRPLELLATPPMPESNRQALVTELDSIQYYYGGVK